MKKCSRCGEEKDLSLFQVRRASKDGFTAACKSCLKKYDDSRLKNPKRMEARRAYQKTNNGAAAHTKAAKAWRKKNKRKSRAHSKVSYEISKGNLIRKPCEVCGGGNTEAHHDDYAEPLNIRWLCHAHHNQWHKENGEGANAQ